LRGVSRIRIQGHCEFYSNCGTLPIPAGYSQFKRAFNHHHYLYKSGESCSHYLLLFYAIECGLKSIYYWKISRSIIMEDVNDKSGHDLFLWAKAIRLPRYVTGKEPKFRLKGEPNKNAVSLAHQAWRYGVQIEREDEILLVAWLKKVDEWIEENIYP
ncbi:MAG: hypothetical protein WA137_11965, partial [Methanothrix sp.]